MKDNCKLEEDQLKKISGGWKTETEKVYYFNKGDCFHDDITNADFKILEDYSRGDSLNNYIQFVISLYF